MSDPIRPNVMDLPMSELTPAEYAHVLREIAKATAGLRGVEVTVTRRLEDADEPLS